MGVSGLAAWLPLAWRAGLQEGETVLVLGASGVVGQIAVQAAKLLGAGRVVAAARDADALERTRALGADETVQITGDELAPALREAAGGDGYDVVLDPLWGAAGRGRGARDGAVRPAGQPRPVGGRGGDVRFGPVRGKPVSIFGYTNYTAGEERKAAAYAQLTRHVAAGDIRIELERIGLDDLPGAWRRQGSSHRKVVVIP